MVSQQPVINNLLETVTSWPRPRWKKPSYFVLIVVVLFLLLGWSTRHDMTTVWIGWHLWNQRDQVTQTAAQLVHQVQTPETDPTHIASNLSSLQAVLDQAAVLQSEFEQSIVLSKLKNPTQTRTVLNQAQTVVSLATKLGQGKHRVIVLLQNDDELRATGGFMGSFADISLAGGVIQTQTIHDIYEPAGQFTDLIEAPPGLAEYLSAGKGLALPDANWHPDFPSSATDILHFLALAGWQDIDLVVAINTSLIETVLNSTGPLYLPDYGITVTADNLATVARADRVVFFPGSKAKSNLLNSLLTQLKLKLSQLSPTQLLTLSQTLSAHLQRSALLAYSPNAALNQHLVSLGVSGELPVVSEEQWLLYPVESNVGINKANAGVSREWQLSLGEYRSQLTVTFTNNNRPDPLESDTPDYINYFRLIVPVNMSIKTITVNGQSQEHWSSRPLTTLAKNSYLELGWLVAVPHQTSTTVVVELNHPRLTPTTTIVWPLQPGVPPSPLVVNFEDQQLETVVDHSTQIFLQPFRLE